MAFLKNVTTEFGKKTGKALGNKLYGAYADDKRVGVNRGKLKGESDGLKIAMENQNRQAQREHDREMRQAQIEYEREIHQAQIERERGMFDGVLNIGLDPRNKDALIESLTTLSVFVDMWAKDSNPDEHLTAAKSKFDTGVAMLQAIDPNNPMVHYFLQKKTDLKKAKKKENIGMWLFIIGTLAFLILMALFADKL